MISRTGTTPIIFGYNGLYGVVTDANGLLYMRARYYSPTMRRFVNADVIPGNISKAVTLNRYAFADANPVLLMDPTGFSPWSWFKSHVIDPVGDAIVEGYNTAKDWVVDTATEIGNTVVHAYNTAKDWVVDTATDIGDAVVNTYQTAKNTIVDTANKVGNAVEDGFHSATTWIDENVIQPVGDFFENTARQIKDGTKKVMSKVTDSFINSIEAKVYFGTGIGVSVENGGADINKSIVIGLDDGKEYAGHEFNVEVGIGIIGYSSNHLHLSEKDYSPVRCDSDHVYDRKTIANILSCPETIHTDSISVGPVSITQNGDVSVSLDGSIFAVIGGGFSVGINLTEFFGGIFG